MNAESIDEVGNTFTIILGDFTLGKNLEKYLARYSVTKINERRSLLVEVVT